RSRTCADQARFSVRRRHDSSPGLGELIREDLHGELLIAVHLDPSVAPRNHDRSQLTLAKFDRKLHSKMVRTRALRVFHLEARCPKPQAQPRSSQALQVRLHSPPEFLRRFGLPYGNARLFDQQPELLVSTAGASDSFSLVEREIPELPHQHHTDDCDPDEEERALRAVREMQSKRSDTEEDTHRV